MALSILISAWLVGALGGLHCAAMCGGLLTAVASRDAALQPLLPARAIALRQLAYHAGRVATYAALGIAFGAAGASALALADVLPLQRLLYVTANVFLLLLGVSLVFPVPPMAWLQRAGAHGFAAVLPILAPWLRRPGAAGRIVLGLAWGFVPCALVYSVLPLALFSGGPWQGGATLLAFGLGTVPNLFAAGMLLERVKRTLGERRLRFAAAALLTAFASVGIWRVLGHADALGQGPFCLAP